MEIIRQLQIQQKEQRKMLGGIRSGEGGNAKGNRKAEAGKQGPEKENVLIFCFFILFIYQLIMKITDSISCLQSAGN